MVEDYLPAIDHLEARLNELDARLLVWCIEIAGRRIHGTTKEQPLARFDTIERFSQMPATPYALATWKQAKHHPDCHVVFDHAFYSAPHRLIGQKLWVRGANTSVRIFYQHEARRHASSRDAARAAADES